MLVDHGGELVIVRLRLEPRAGSQRCAARTGGDRWPRHRGAEGDRAIDGKSKEDVGSTERRPARRHMQLLQVSHVELARRQRSVALRRARTGPRQDRNLGSAVRRDEPREIHGRHAERSSANRWWQAAPASSSHPRRGTLPRSAQQRHSTSPPPRSQRALAKARPDRRDTLPSLSGYGSARPPNVQWSEPSDGHQVVCRGLPVWRDRSAALRNSRGRARWPSDVSR